MSRRARILRYGTSIALALLGVACGALIPGTAGGTAATVLVGLGLVGIVSLVFYEVGLTEDRDRAADGIRRDVADAGRSSPSGGEHRGARLRSLDRRRGQRRRLR